MKLKLSEKALILKRISSIQSEVDELYRRVHAFSNAYEPAVEPGSFEHKLMNSVAGLSNVRDAMNKVARGLR